MIPKMPSNSAATFQLYRRLRRRRLRGPISLPPPKVALSGSAAKGKPRRQRSRTEDRGPYTERVRRVQPYITLLISSLPDRRALSGYRSSTRPTKARLVIG